MPTYGQYLKMKRVGTDNTIPIFEKYKNREITAKHYNGVTNDMYRWDLAIYANTFILI